MNAAVTSFAHLDPAAVLDRHAYRRTTGVPTVSLLVGPIGAGVGTWRRWATAKGRSVVVANGNLFPSVAWVRSVAEQIDLPRAAVQCLARRAERDPDEFLASWRVKTLADRERFWSTLEPEADDDLLRQIAILAVNQSSPSSVSTSLSNLGECSRSYPESGCILNRLPRNPQYFSVNSWMIVNMSYDRYLSSRTVVDFGSCEVFSMVFV